MSKIEGQIRIPSGCAIAAVLSREGRLMTGETIIESMKPMPVSYTHLTLPTILRV